MFEILFRNIFYHTLSKHTHMHSMRFENEVPCARKKNKNTTAAAVEQDGRCRRQDGKTADVDGKTVIHVIVTCDSYV